MLTAYLCKCNNCDNILVDENPQIKAKEHELSGEELQMIYVQDGDTWYWVCPICLTDSYLIDM